MTKRRRFIIELAAASAAFLLSFLFAESGQYLLSGSVLILTGCFFFAAFLKESGKLINSAAFFSVSWLGGVGVSSLKLSYLQTDWAHGTWLTFWFIFAAFLAGYRLKEFLPAGNLHGTEAEKAAESEGLKIRKKGELYALLAAIHIVLFLSAAALIFEAYKLQYIPLFTRDTPHAYSYFHVTGVHYFTVSCCLIPSLSVLYLTEKQAVTEYSAAERADLCLVNVCALVIPLLLVSRFQLLFSVFLAAMTWLAVRNVSLSTLHSPRFLIGAFSGFVLLTVLYVYITFERAHSVEYLNGIFEMKSTSVPIFVSQPYIYIANNFDNFNCLVTGLQEHTKGLRMLFPAFAFTGMKFSHPELVSFPLYITKEELTTVTLFYDAYYDFGFFGAGALAMILGALSSWMEKEQKKTNRNVIVIFLYAQLCFYLLFAFFTTWFSNPATWFYIIASAGIGIFIRVCSMLLVRLKLI